MADKFQNNPNSLVNSPFYAGYPAWHRGTSSNSPAMKAPGSAQGVRTGNPAMPAAYPSPRRTAPTAPAVTGPAKYVKYQPKEYDAYAKQKRKERDYFWVMRKGVCFFMLVIAIAMVAVVALGIVGLPAVEQYTAMFVENGTETSVNIPFGDAVYGFIGKITGTEMLDANGLPYTYQANADAVAAGIEAHPEDSMGAIAGILVQYFPAAIVVLIIFALVIAVLALLSMFGKRIFKGFGALAIVMLLMGVIAAAAGLAILGIKSGAPYVDAETGLLVSILDFSKVVAFLTGAFSAIKEVYIAGTGLFILLAGSIVLLLLSMFARRKVPYSVFDR